MTSNLISHNKEAITLHIYDFVLLNIFIACIQNKRNYHICGYFASTKKKNINGMHDEKFLPRSYLVRVMKMLYSLNKCLA